MPHPLLTAADYSASVVAVPPIALTGDGRVDMAANARIMQHIVDGGISVLLYGGNANLYHFGTALYREAVEGLHAISPVGGNILFSVGPDFGRALEQTDELRRMGVKNIMLLPTAFPSSPAGVAEGACRIAEALGHGIVLYIRREHYIDPDTLAALIEAGTLSFVKYAVERPDAADDAYLDALLRAVPARLIASGMGETPILDHIGRRRLATFTSGAACIAPRTVGKLLAWLRAGRLDEAAHAAAPFLEFERLRSRFGGIAMLHDAVALAGIADTGPMLPMLANLDAAARAAIAPSVQALLAAEAASS